MNKLVTLYRTEDGVPYDIDWSHFREWRDMALDATDVHMLTDKFQALTEEQLESITIFSQWLRDAPDNYESANEACDNWPPAEDWW